MADEPLSAGFMAAVYFDTPSLEVAEPVLQVLQLKKVSSSGAARVGADGQAAPDRYRVILSDGVHYMQCMIATQKNDVIATGVIDKNTILRLKQYAKNQIQGRKILIVLDFDVLGMAENRLGEPVTVEQATAPDAMQVDAPTENNAAEAAKPAAAAAAPAPAAKANNAPAAKAPAARAGGGTGRSGGPAAPIYPIEGLSPYQNKWTIKARVINKSDIRHWSNQRGDGKLFNVTLMDETGEIRATGFNDAVDRLFNIFEEGKVYFISKARVNIAKKQFSNVNNEYEIMFENHTEVEPCNDTENVPQIKYNFINLSDLTSIEKDSTCDVLAVVKEVGEVTSITSKASQKPVSKRELTLVDQSNYSVRLTLWGKSAESFEAPDEPVIAFKGVKVGDFGGRSLSMMGSSAMMPNPDIQEAHQLRGWYDRQGNTQSFTSHTSTGGGGTGGQFKEKELLSVAQIRDQQLGMNEKPDFFSMRGTLVYFKQDNLSYPACPTDKCNKKVILEGENQWRCEKCDMTHAAPEYRYILSVNVLDATGNLWLNGFNDIGPLLIGKSAGEMEELKNNDQAAFNAQAQKALSRQYNFNIMAKSESYNDVTRVRYNVKRASPVDYITASNHLIEEIAAYGIA